MNNYINKVRSVKDSYSFNAGQPSSNRRSLQEVFVMLRDAAMQISSTSKSQYIDFLKTDDVMELLNGLRFEADYQPLAFSSTKAARDQVGYPLMTCNGKNIVVLYDFGTMATGVFSESEFHQFALVFHDPTQEGVEVGFSLNVKGGPTIIVPPVRVELYPSYALLSESPLSYRPMKYYDLTGDDYKRYNMYEENGAKKTPSLWEKFKSL